MAERIRPGDWVEITRAPAGRATQVKEATGIQVGYRGTEVAEVTLFDEHRHRVETFNINPRWLRKVDEPKFRHATSHIEETPEVLAAKDIMWTIAHAYKSRHGLCGVLEQSLKEMGIEKPPSGTVKVKLEFDVELPVEDVVAGSNHLTFAEEFGRLRRDDQVERVLNIINTDEGDLTFEVVPPKDRLAAKKKVQEKKETATTPVEAPQVIVVTDGITSGSQLVTA